jgi:hypothetical protein
MGNGAIHRVRRIWLGTKAMNSRKKPGVAFWASVVVVTVLIGYPLLFGPAQFVRVQQRCPQWLDDTILIVYGPIIWLLEYHINLVPDWYKSYFAWWQSL